MACRRCRGCRGYGRLNFEVSPDDAAHSRLDAFGVHSPLENRQTEPVSHSANRPLITAYFDETLDGGPPLQRRMTLSPRLSVRAEWCLGRHATAPTPQGARHSNRFSARTSSMNLAPSMGLNR